MYRVGFLGTREQVAPWRRAVQRLPAWREGPVFQVEEPEPDSVILRAFLEQVDVVAVASKPGVRNLLVQEALKQGRGVFTCWPPAVSLLEWNRLVQLAEESGVEPVISQPLRFHPRIQKGTRPARLLVHRWEVRTTTEMETPFPWLSLLAMAVDLYLYLTNGTYLRSFDVEVLRHKEAIPDAIAMNLRFQNGAYVQSFLVRTREKEEHTLLVSDGKTLETWHLHMNEAESSSYDAGAISFNMLMEREFTRYLAAWATGVHDEVLCTDGLPLMRILESLMARIRW